MVATREMTIGNWRHVQTFFQSFCNPQHNAIVPLRLALIKSNRQSDHKCEMMSQENYSTYEHTCAMRRTAFKWKYIQRKAAAGPDMNTRQSFSVIRCRQSGSSSIQRMTMHNFNGSIQFGQPFVLVQSHDSCTRFSIYNRKSGKKTNRPVFVLARTFLPAFE